MKVSEQIIQVLNALCEKFGLMIDWTNANVVPYLIELCSRICMYEIATSIFWMIIGAIMIIGSIIYFRCSWKNPINWNTYDITSAQANGILSLALLIVFCFTGIMIVCTQTFDIIQAICIPELTIIDKIKSLTASTPSLQ
jgi:hypothetical protein